MIVKSILPNRPSPPDGAHQLLTAAREELESLKKFDCFAPNLTI